MEAAIEAEGLIKTYSKGVTALDGLSFAVRAGSVFGLLGPNGAGKSTAVKILTTLTIPDAGRATVAGVDVTIDPDRVRRCAGVVAQGSGVDVQASGRENLTLQGHLYGLAGRRLHQRVEPGSRGASRHVEGDRLAVARARQDRPADYSLPGGGRPAGGAPGHRRPRQGGRRGHARGAQARTARDAVQVELAAETNGAAHRALDGVVGIRDLIVEGRVLRARADDGGRAVPAVLQALEANDIEVAEVRVARPSLDDVYLRYTGRTFDAADAEAK